MKTLLTTIIVFVCVASIQAQTVKGTVYRGNSDTIVANAVVYYSGSMNGGTMTGKDGRFELIAKNKQIPIIVSCVGYYSSTVNYRIGEPLLVRLQPKVESLHTVTIRPDGLDRKTEIAMFIREFLGTSQFAASCAITNMDDINLFYDKKTSTLTADCAEPIIIQNEKLGYTVTCYMDSFVFKPGEIRYKVSYVFKDNIRQGDQNWPLIQQNRMSAYNGSRMQFIRALWQHTTAKRGYIMYNRLRKGLAEDDILLLDSVGERFVSLPDDVQIINTNFSVKGNMLMQTEDLSFINKEGYYGTGLKWDGPMGTQRMGDLLPLEYQPEKEFEVTDTIAVTRMLGERPKAKRVNVLASVFKRITMVPDDQYSDARVKKWQRPIYYKITGTTGNKEQDDMIHYRTVKLFSMMSGLTGLNMQEADIESAANFLLLIGELPYFKEDLDKATYRHLGDLKAMITPEPGDYRMEKNSITYAVQLIDIRAIGAYQQTWNQLRSQVLTGLGFPGRSGNQRSIFYRGKNNWQPENGLTAADQQIISTLYHPAVRPGMTEQELDAVLKNLN